MTIEADEPLAFLDRADDRPVSLRAGTKKRTRTSWGRWCLRFCFLTCHVLLIVVALIWAGIVSMPDVRWLESNISAEADVPALVFTTPGPAR